MGILNLFKKKKLIITHDSGYHADDVFACATLSILENGNVKIVRTRNPEIIKKGDYVVDVGKEYDAKKNRFDHHQKEGAGKRQNGIPYASFGLVWKSFGSEVCGSEEVAEIIDQYLVQPIDATDNGVDIAKPIFSGLLPYRVNEVIGSFMPTWQEPFQNTEKAFYEALILAKKIIEREIVKTQSEIEANRCLGEAYEKSNDKRILILGKHYPMSDILSSIPEVLLIVRPRGESGESWSVKTVRKSSDSFENRKSLPASWGGLENESLQKITGVADAIFCHKGLFLAAAKSKEGAVKLAEIALKG